MLPGYVAETWFGFIAAAGTPPDVVGKLNDAINRSLDTPEMQQRFTGFGVRRQDRHAQARGRHDRRGRGALGAGDPRQQHPRRLDAGYLVPMSQIAHPGQEERELLRDSVRGFLGQHWPVDSASAATPTRRHLRRSGAAWPDRVSPHWAATPKWAAWPRCWWSWRNSGEPLARCRCRTRCSPTWRCGALGRHRRHGHVSGRTAFGRREVGVGLWRGGWRCERWLRVTVRGSVREGVCVSSMAGHGCDPCADAGPGRRGGDLAFLRRAACVATPARAMGMAGQAELSLHWCPRDRCYRLRPACWQTCSGCAACACWHAPMARRGAPSRWRSTTRRNASSSASRSAASRPCSTSWPTA